MFFQKAFNFEMIPQLGGKVAIITGSNTGIGLVCTREMARKGCHVVMACRNKEKTEAAIAKIIEETGNTKVEFMPLDLLSLQSTKTFATTFKARHGRLDILINNAGIMMCPFSLSEDGIESQFATNHVAPFYLTMLLLPLLEKSTSSRIVNISSMGHSMTQSEINLSTINDKKYYNKTLQYSKSKLANILFTRELAKRLEAKGVENVYVNCNHPGIVNSDLYRHVFHLGGLLNYIFSWGSISTEDGSLTQLYLSTSPEVESKNIRGKYYVPTAKEGTVLSRGASGSAALNLWNYTDELLKEKVPGYTGTGL
ncbi:hypothetical protein BDF14DRAFT_1756509 [Spinellus fusiger]|nr:hypothetical protein BDF14DRAFT_1756509 [Spinellus fusiger]